MNENQGALLERSVRRGGYSITKLAHQLNVSRATVYNWFGQKDLDVLTILKVEQKMGINPWEEVEKYYGITAELDGRCGNGASPDCTGARALLHWMERYISLLENYNSLLEKGRIVLEPGRLCGSTDHAFDRSDFAR